MPFKNVKDLRNYHIKYYKDNPHHIVIAKWKYRGIIDSDFKALYDYFIQQTHCWICNKRYSEKMGYDKRVLDHCHETGEVRYICCNGCNIHVVS